MINVKGYYTKASQQFGLTKRTCHFVKDFRRRRALYLSLIRSQFEHCSPIWRPVHKTMIDKLECFQKRCIKWILSEEFYSYVFFCFFSLQQTHTTKPQDLATST